MMSRGLALVAVVSCVLSALTFAQTASVPQPSFTARDAERGLAIAKKQWELRGQVDDNLGEVEPFKISGNLYFVGVRNGDSFLLTSPQGHILIGAGFEPTTGLVERSIERLGFKLTDIKAIVINHHHGNQAGGAPYFRQKTSARVMVGFSDVGFVERGRAAGSPSPVAALAAPTATREEGPSPFGNFATPTSLQGLKQVPVKVDRALFDGDVIKVGPLSVVAYSNPLHTLGAMTFAFTVREGDRDLKVAQYCCWELEDDFSKNPNLSEAAFQKVIDMHRKLAPVDIYLESGTYGWGGMVSQPSGTWAQRFEKLRTDNRLFINRDIFPAVAAAREVFFAQNLARLKVANPHLR